MSYPSLHRFIEFAVLPLLRPLHTSRLSLFLYVVRLVNKICCTSVFVVIVPHDVF